MIETFAMLSAIEDPLYPIPLSIHHTPHLSLSHLPYCFLTSEGTIRVEDIQVCYIRYDKNSNNIEQLFHS